MRIGKAALGSVALALLGFSAFAAGDGGDVGSQAVPVSDPRSGGAAASQALSGLSGEWRRAGAGFACVVGPAGELPRQALEPDLLAKACLHMGPFAIGGTASSLTLALGKPAHTLPQPQDSTAWVYFLDEPERSPYLVATVRQDEIVALQVSGAASANAYGFNHVNLGDGAETLTGYFGPAIKVEPSGSKDTELWSYAPWPFSFELTNGRVTSIRIVDPAH